MSTVVDVDVETAEGQGGVGRVARVTGPVVDVEFRVLVAAALRVEPADFGVAAEARFAADFFAAGFFVATFLLELEADVREAGLRAVVFFLVAADELLLAAFLAVFFFTTFAAVVLPMTFELDAAFFLAGVFFVALRVAIQVSFFWNLVEPWTPLPLTAGCSVVREACTTVMPPPDWTGAEHDGAAVLQRSARRSGSISCSCSPIVIASRSVANPRHS